MKLSALKPLVPSEPLVHKPTEIVNIYVDPSCLAKTKCPRQWHYVVRRGLLVKSTAGPFAFGHAVHKYADLVVNGRPSMEALAHVQTAYPIAINESEQLMRLCTSWPQPKSIIRLHDGRLAHELYVEHQVFECIVDNKLYRVFACGTLDCLRMSDKGDLILVDYKTTRWATKERALREYEDGVQFRFYAWWLHKYGHEVLPMNYSNLIRDGKFYVMLLIGMLNARPPGWEWSRAFRYTPAQIDEFDGLMEEVMKGLVRWYIAEDPPKVGWINQACATCDFTQFCDNDMFDGSTLAQVQFTQRPYRPSEFGKH